MEGFRHRLAMLIATKDRPREIRTVLAEIARQSALPDQIVVVDSSGVSQESLPGEFPQLPILYRTHRPPSASAQRNIAISLVREDIDLIGFFDDDITFPECAIANMMKFWDSADRGVAGAAFNLLNHPKTPLGWMKRSRFADWIGLYSRRRGIVTPSGWQTLVGTVEADLETEWLCSGASVWRKDLVLESRFDPFYDGYSYLEDLDFSHFIWRKGHRLVVVRDAGFYHWPAPSGRVSSVRFGMVETRNRLHFVRKFRFSLARCFAGIFVRGTMSVASGLFCREWAPIGRAWGNLAGIAAFFGRRRRP